MIIDPDCGMRMLNQESTIQKLKNMTEAVNGYPNKSPHHKIGLGKSG